MLRAIRRTLLLPLIAAAPALRAQNAAPAQVVVTGAQVAALDARLHRFAETLPVGERRHWNALLRRAAAAPASNPAATTVHATLYRPVPSNHIIVQGGGRPLPSNHIVVQGGTSPRPSGTAAATGAVAIGPKQDDPSPPPPLMDRLRSFSASLGAEDRATLDWLLTRAGAAPAPSPVLGGNTPTLAQALGISPLAIGPKQDDPSPPPPADARWV
ncbi:MAG TPA: hypothetical protein VFH27_00960, partial [Longimicrobiaceae bacterium]|nr:hypothetical protein [Longimicrobiaceae bacterium]